MTEFASRLNSSAEQRALLARIIDEFDAVEVPSSGWEKARRYAEGFRLIPSDEELREHYHPRHHPPSDEQLSLGDAA